MKKTILAALLSAIAATALADINVGITLSATGPAASLGIPEKNTILSRIIKSYSRVDIFCISSYRSFCVIKKKHANKNEFENSEFFLTKSNNFNPNFDDEGL